MKLLYISKAFEGNIGATMHYNALKELYGVENVYTIDLRPLKAYRRDKYIAYGKYATVFERIIRWTQGNMMFISNKIIDEIVSYIQQEKFDVVFIEDSVFGNLVKAIKNKDMTVRVVTFYHDIKASLYPQWIKHTKWVNKIEDTVMLLCHDKKASLYPQWIKHTKWVNKIEYTVGIRQERLNSRMSDCNVVFNERDAIEFNSYYGRRPEAIIPLPAPVPSVSHDIKNSITTKNDKKKILFVGKKYYPNLIGFKWFVDNVLPSLTDNIQVDVVGRGLEELRNEYSDSRINVIGGVESLNPYYENADIVIAPLFDGGGMKSKTVEALSFGKIFVGTEESLFGFWEEMDSDIRGKTCYQCNTPEEWIQTINNLTNDDIHKFNEDVFELFKAKFSYDVIRDQLKAIMEE